MTLSIAAEALLPQGAKSQASSCLSIQVRLNGELLKGPQAITLRSKQGENTVIVEEGCFKVPPALLAEKALDVVFTVPRNKIHLSAIPIGFFADPWEVDLEDKKFDSSDVVLPKHARVKESCAVLFHVGEPETVISESRCRTPLPPNGATREK